MTTPPTLTRLAAGVRRRLNQSSGRPVWHPIGDLSIELPAEHLLPQYQAVHPHYDRFLPKLAAALGAGDVVIDVGANCGDTLAAMRQAHRGLEFICVEPDDGFFAYLERNTARLLEAAPGGRIHLVKSLAGQQTGPVVLSGGGGTRTAAAGDSGTGAGLASRTLDDIVFALGEDVARRVRLLKSDVDGWDHDVLDSATRLLQQVHPLLFFECQPVTEAQHLGTLHTLRRLSEAGYRHFFMFDNYGSFMLRCDGLQGALQLIEYAWQQQLGRATRTVHYFDVLACTAADLALAGPVVEGRAA
jgi:FkbM family methyltransferase